MNRPWPSEPVQGSGGPVHELARLGQLGIKGAGRPGSALSLQDTPSKEAPERVSAPLGPMTGGTCRQSLRGHVACLNPMVDHHLLKVPIRASKSPWNTSPSDRNMYSMTSKNSARRTRE